MNITEIVNSTSDAAFVVDQRGRLLAWNAAAESLFGHKASEVVGRRCWKVLAGRDVYGNVHCQKDCQLRRMALSGGPIHPCEMVFRNAVGEPVRTKVSLLAQGQPDSAAVTLLHMLCPTAPAQPDHVIGWRMCANKTGSRLTPREREVLALLAEGKTTKTIAEELGLSPATIRNHSQHILRKLRVHSRLEAVALGRRLGLIC